MDSESTCPGSILVPVEGKCSICGQGMAAGKSAKRGHKMPPWLQAKLAREAEAQVEIKT